MAGLDASDASHSKDSHSSLWLKAGLLFGKQKLSDRPKTIKSRLG
nr:hypothetical protein [Trichocoleus desertorum]